MPDSLVSPHSLSATSLSWLSHSRLKTWIVVVLVLVPSVSDHFEFAGAFGKALVAPEEPMVSGFESLESGVFWYEERCRFRLDRKLEAPGRLNNIRKIGRSVGMQAAMMITFISILGRYISFDVFTIQIADCSK